MDVINNLFFRSVKAEVCHGVKFYRMGFYCVYTPSVTRIISAIENKYIKKLSRHQNSNLSNSYPGYSTLTIVIRRSIVLVTTKFVGSRYIMSFYFYYLLNLKQLYIMDIIRFICTTTNYHQ